MYVTDLEQAATYITYMRDSKEAEEADIRSDFSCLSFSGNNLTFLHKDA